MVGCLGWASAAFKVAARDRWIGWSQEARRCRLHLLANNVRFVLLPWVRVKHLASKALAQSVRGLSEQWEERYGHPLVLAETFVETGRFAGTCYRAANWQAVGQSRGMPSKATATGVMAWPRPIMCIPCAGTGARYWSAKRRAIRSNDEPGGGVGDPGLTPG